MTDMTREIYIDFEGFMDKTPSLLGILVEDEFEQVVLDPSLRLAAIAKDLRISTLEAEVRSLVKRCEQEGRKIVA